MPSASLDPEASAVTRCGSRPTDGFTTREAVGRITTCVFWNSSAPRSAYATGPTPVLGVAGSSRRALPSASVAGQFATAEFAASIAGDPFTRWKSPAHGSRNAGSAWIESSTGTSL